VRRATREQLAALTWPTAPELHQQIRHWLLVLEEIRDLWRDAPRRPFTRTGCGRGIDHNWHVRLVPRPPHRTTRLICAVPQIHLPLRVVMGQIIEPLHTEGFAVADIATQRCGCATFTVSPRRLAEG